MKSLILFFTILMSLAATAETKLELIQDQRLQVPAGPFYDNSRPFYGRQLLKASYRTAKSFFIHQGTSPKPGSYSTLVSLDAKNNKLEKIASLAFVTGSSLEVYERRNENDVLEDILRLHQFDSIGNQLVYSALEFNMQGKLLEQIRPEYIVLHLGDVPRSFRIVAQIDPTRGQFMQDDYVPGFLVSFWNEQSQSRVIYYLQRKDEYGTEMELKKIDGLQPSDLVVGAYHIGGNFNYIITRGANGQFQTYQLSEQFPKRYVWLPLATETVQAEKFFEVPFVNSVPSPIPGQVTFALPEFIDSQYAKLGEDILANYAPNIGGYVVAEFRGTKFYVTQTDENTRLERTSETEGTQITLKDQQLCKKPLNKSKITCVNVSGANSQFINIVNIDRIPYYAVKTAKMSESTEDQFIQLYNAETLALSYQIPTSGDVGVEVEVADGWSAGTWVIVKRTYEISATLLKSLWAK